MNIEDIREYCLTKPHTDEAFPFGETTLVFRLMGKIFACLDLERPNLVVLKCEPDYALELRYDLWCKMRFFGDMLHKDLEGEHTSVQRGPVSLLTLLPKEFTREDVRALRIAQGMSPDPKAMISKWVTRGMVVKDEAAKTYSKLK